MLSVLIVAVLGTIGVAIVARRFSREVRPLLWMALAAHGMAAWAQVWITTGVYGSGDMTLYHELGGYVARWIELDPSSAWPETIRLLLRDDSAWFPFDVIRPGDPTGAMVALSGVLEVMLGDSLLAKCLALSLFGLVAKGYAASALNGRLNDVSPQVVVTCCCLVPSVVYWTSGLLKESVAVSGLCFVVAGADAWARRSRVEAIVAVVVGAALVSLAKPFLFLPLIGGFSAAAYFRSGRGLTLKVSSVVWGGAIAIGGVVAIGKVFPAYAFDSALQHAAYLQEVGASVDGGSNYSIGAGDGSMVAQLSLAPLGILSALFRPLPFEVRNAVMAISALETTALLVWVSRSFVGGTGGVAWRWTATSSVAMGMLAFVLICAMAVGISSTNLGTLSRYRVPLVPAAFILALAWRSVTRSSRRRGFEPVMT